MANKNLKQTLVSRIIKRLSMGPIYFLYSLIKQVQKKGKEREKQQLIKDIKKFGPNSYLWGETHIITCPENIEIGENVHVDDNCYIRAEGGVTIGDNTHISRNLLLHSFNHNYEGNYLPYDENIVCKPVIIGKNVSIEMNVTITPGTVIGDGAIIKMGTVVSGIIPPLAIISPQKWEQTGERDKEHYEILENAGRYGKRNGHFYDYKKKVLKQIGDRKNSLRSILEVIDFKGKIAVRKTFFSTNDGIIAFNNEKLAAKKFKNYSWYPQVYEINENSITYEFFDNDLRLDKSISNYNQEKKNEILGQIIAVLFDLFTENIAHRDIHARNIFYSEKVGIKLIDFESMENISNVDIDFLDSYDVIGQGLNPPFSASWRRCLCDKELDFSIVKTFGIKNEEKIKAIAKKVLQDKNLGKRKQ